MSNASFRLESFRPWNPFQDKSQPLRDSLDICRYPSPVSMTPTPPPSNPVDPVSKSQYIHAHEPGRHPIPDRPPLEVCLDDGLHSDAQPTRHEPENLRFTTLTSPHAETFDSEDVLQLQDLPSAEDIDSAPISDNGCLGAEHRSPGFESCDLDPGVILEGHNTIVEILLDAGADVNAQGGEYGNALQAAAALGGSPEKVKILLDAGADVNAQGGQHGSPFLAAIYSGHADLIEILFHAGADIGLADALDQTPLHIAALKDMAHLLFRFPQLASAINKRNKLLQTPLHLAICFGHIHFAIKLLHLGAGPSLPDGYGRHAMDWQGTLMREILERCPRLSLTPHKIQESIVQQSLFYLSDHLRKSFGRDIPLDGGAPVDFALLFADAALVPSDGNAFYFGPIR
ncbi:hypothetical protein N7537_010460 [Penicillium hordei]|uniref:Uncharacterized protein n=1 Tax=Penicillium hordei TaxID=40994 RepID=A0AAD6DV07_9EURO|nr:uncharacterized protein N7537_010460 [Penicillium hordei]KAJ5593556.1 hypothetical protein N7537_010460 [Penicillium hordei]